MLLLELKYLRYSFRFVFQLLDLCILDEGSVRSPYSMLAAAAMCYTSSQDVALSVSGLIFWKHSSPFCRIAIVLNDFQLFIILWAEGCMHSCNMFRKPFLWEKKLKLLSLFQALFDLATSLNCIHCLSYAWRRDDSMFVPFEAVMSNCKHRL